MEELNRLIEQIRERAIRVTLEPDEWVRISLAIDDLQNYLNDLMVKRDPNAYLINETARQKIITDMLLSFVCSMAGGTSPITSNAITSFFTVDKKWVGVEDESIAVDLMYLARYDIVSRLNGFSYENMIQFIIGMRYYICKFGLMVKPEEAEMFYEDLKHYFTSGRLMETDEHSWHVFIDMAKLQVDGNNQPIDVGRLLNVIIDAAVRCIRIACNEITHSQYNHNSVDNRLYAVNKFEQELSKAVYDAMLTFYNDCGLRLNTIPTTNDPHVHILDGNYQHAALRAVCDVLIRLIMYSHILSSEGSHLTSVRMSVFDTVMIRRELENEATNIRYQESAGGQNIQRRVPIQRVRTQFRYPGQGLNTGFYI